MTLTYSALMTAKPDEYLESARQLSVAVTAIGDSETALSDRVLTPMSGDDSWSGPAQGDAVSCTLDHTTALASTRQELANAAKAFTLLAGDLSEAQLRMEKARGDAEANGVNISADGTAIAAPVIASANPGTSTELVYDPAQVQSATITANLAKDEFEATRNAILEYVGQLDEGCARLLNRIDPSQLAIPTNMPRPAGSLPPVPADLDYLNDVFKTDLRVGRDDADTTDPVVDVLSEISGQLAFDGTTIKYIDKLNGVMTKVGITDDLPPHTVQAMDNLSEVVDGGAFKTADRSLGVAGVGLTLTSYLHKGDDWVDAIGKTAVEETSAWAGAAGGAKGGAATCTAIGQPELAPVCGVVGGIGGGILGSEFGEKVINWISPDDNLDPTHSFLIELADNREELAEYNSTLTVENAVDAFTDPAVPFPSTPDSSMAEVFERAATENAQATNDGVRRGVTIGADAAPR